MVLQHISSGRRHLLIITAFVSSFFLNIFIYLILPALGLHCWAWALSSCSEWEPFSSRRWTYHGGLPCCGAWALSHSGFHSCMAWAQLLWHMGFSCPTACGVFPKLLSPALATGLLTTGPRRKSWFFFCLGGPLLSPSPLSPLRNTSSGLSNSSSASAQMLSTQRCFGHWKQPPTGSALLSHPSLTCPVLSQSTALPRLLCSFFFWVEINSSC